METCADACMNWLVHMLVPVDRSETVVQKIKYFSVFEYYTCF